MKLVWGLNLWRMAKLREFNQRRIWNALGGLTPEFRVISELLGHLRRSAIGREDGSVELADHQRCWAAETLELVHDRLSDQAKREAAEKAKIEAAERAQRESAEKADREAARKVERDAAKEAKREAARIAKIEAAGEAKRQAAGGEGRGPARTG